MQSVLLIDDDRGAWRLVERMLRSTHALTWCSDCDSALDVMLTGAHDAWLIDYYLPDGDGLELLDRARRAGRGTAALLLTGATDPHIDRRAIELGASARLDKSHLDAERLTRAIRYAVHQARALATLAEREARQRALLVEQLRPRMDQLERLAAAEREVRQALAHDAIELDRPLFFGRLLDAGLHLTGCAAGFIGTVDATGRVEPEAVVGLPGVEPEAPRHSQPGATSLVGRALTTRTPQVGVVAGSDGAPPSGACALPILIAERLAGVVLLAERADPMDPAEVEALDPYAELCGGAIARYEIDTRRRAAEAERLRVERRFRALVEHSSDLLLVLDADGCVRYQSPSVQGALGWPPEALAGRPLAERVHPDDLGRSAELLRDLLARPGELLRLELRLRNTAGAWRVLDVTVQNALEAPDVAGLIVNAHDITAQRRLWARYLRAQKMDSLGRLAVGIAHDFNNLLTVIMSSASTGRFGLDPDHPAQVDLVAILDASEVARRLTRQLLLFASAEPTRPRPVDTARLLARSHTIWQRLLDGAVQLELDVEDAVSPMQADPSQIEQVLLNLVLNARDAMPDGGRITIRAGDANAPTESDPPTPYGGDPEETGEYGSRIDPAPEDRYVVLAVADTGVGMTPEVQRRIFDPFFTTKSRDKGTGLGLATVFGIVRRHRGRLTVESAPGEGSTFRVWLPRATSRASHPG